MLRVINLEQETTQFSSFNNNLLIIKNYTRILSTDLIPLLEELICIIHPILTFPSCPNVDPWEESEKAIWEDALIHGIIPKFDITLDGFNSASYINVFQSNNTHPPFKLSILIPLTE